MKYLLYLTILFMLSQSCNTKTVSFESESNLTFDGLILNINGKNMVKLNSVENSKIDTLIKYSVKEIDYSHDVRTSLSIFLNGKAIANNFQFTDLGGIHDMHYYIDSNMKISIKRVVHYELEIKKLFI